jgi:hypothetical protein
MAVATISSQQANAQQAIQAESFEFTRMEISSYLLNNDTQQQSDFKSMVVSLNPTTYKRSFKTGDGSQFNNNKRTKADGSLYTIKTVQLLETVSFELMLDNTGIVPGSQDVTQTLNWLETNLASYDGEAHTTRYAKLNWGYLNMTGQLQSMDVDLLMFNQDGSPVRAKVFLSFEGVFEGGATTAQNRRSSPDLSRVRLIKDGDTLPAICNEVYKDPSLYIQVAEVNGLSNLIRLTPGDTIYLPPLKNS